MDRERINNLEAHVVQVIEAFARMQEENRQLRREVKQLQATFQAQEKELAQYRPEREELLHLRTVMQTFLKERGLIRQKLEQMLTTIEWLEGHARMDGETKA